MIHVIWPTVRYEAAAKMATLWYSSAADKTSLHFIFGIDHSSLIDFGKSNCPLNGVPHATIVGCDMPDGRKGCTWAATKISRNLLRNSADNDLFILASDDWEPEAEWDRSLGLIFDCSRPEIPILNDGYAKPTNIMGLPAMNKKALEKLNGIIYHPAYCHMWSDQELFYIAPQVATVKNLRGEGAPRFNHLHWSFLQHKPDEHHNAVSALSDKDRATYEARKDLPLEEKLKLPEGWKD